MKCRLAVSGNMLTAYLDGEIDHHSVQPVRESIDNAIDRNQPNSLVLDFSDVTFMDSSGIGLIMGRFRETSRLGAQLYIFNPQPPIEKLLLIAGMDKLAKIQTNGKKEKYKR